LDASSPPRPRLRFPVHPPYILRRAGHVLVALLLLTALVPQAVSAVDWAPPRTVFVTETGHTTDGLFLALWREQRDLLGDPVTEEMQPGLGWRESTSEGQIVQYYENAALIYLPDEDPDSQVQLLDLGRQALSEALASRPSLALSRAAERTLCPGSTDDCVGFVASGHTLRGAFRSFGESEAGSLLGLPLTEAFRAADGTLVQYFEHSILRLDQSGTVQPLPLGRQVATRLQLDTDPITPPDDVPPYDESLFVPPPEHEATPVADGGAWSVGSFGPGPQQGAWKEIVVSISAQAMWAYESGELVRSSYVSTGTAEVPETTTPIGYWSILTKYDIQDMEGTISDEYYFVEDVPDVMYFDNLGNALHGTYWHSNFGAPMSHGCVNLPLDVASWMYDWAPVGTAVSVIA
jgi:hypothetical protein